MWVYDKWVWTGVCRLSPLALCTDAESSDDYYPLQHLQHPTIHHPPSPSICLLLTEKQKRWT